MIIPPDTVIVRFTPPPSLYAREMEKQQRIAGAERKQRIFSTIEAQQRKEYLETAKLPSAELDLFKRGVYVPYERTERPKPFIETIDGQPQFRKLGKEDITFLANMILLSIYTAELNKVTLK